MEVKVPDIGDFDEVPVIEIHVSPGDEVEVEQALVTLESDKATMDVPSPEAGTVKEVLVEVNDKVSEGTPIVVMEGGEASEPSSETSDEPEPPSSDAESEKTGQGVPRDHSRREKGADSDGGAVYAGPGVRRMARELEVDLASVTGSGRKGRILKEDVKAAKDAPGKPAKDDAHAGIPGLDLAPWPKVDFEKYGKVERVKLSRIKKISGPALSRNWVMIPHVTHDDEADITELEAFRKEVNAEEKDVKVTMVALLVKACVGALRQFPEFNSSLDGDELVIKRYFNIGFAADTPQGLLVPVIKEADRKGLLDIARELGELSGKAREGKISAEEMRGSTFTISSLGGIGGTGFTPIINAPEVAILGVTRSKMQPVWDSEAEEFKPRLMVPLSLSYDHRVIDGAAAARFTAHLANELSDIRRALL